MERDIRGTALYCGIGIDTDTMKVHLKAAAEVGINAMFTSLQLPEADKNTLVHDFLIMSDTAHQYGIQIDADIGPRTATQFGIDLKDTHAIKELGIDVMRLDYGYTPEETAEISHNTDGVMIELNADNIKEAKIEKYLSLGINRENVRFCHNYYPMRYTGLRQNDCRRFNEIIHRYGFRVAGFIASQTHKRIACAIGLPTVEDLRNHSARVAAMEMFQFGIDDIFFGDDLASADEMKALTSTDRNLVRFRLIRDFDDPVFDFISTRNNRQMSAGNDYIIRTPYSETYKGNTEIGEIRPRKKGDVVLCGPDLWRYTGEIQICRVDLPAEENFRVIGRISDEDMPLLECYRNGVPFTFENVRGIS